MRGKTFESSYSKLFLVTEAVYNRIMKQLDSKIDFDDVSDLKQYNELNEDAISNEAENNHSTLESRVEDLEAKVATDDSIKKDTKEGNSNSNGIEMPLEEMSAESTSNLIALPNASNLKDTVNVSSQTENNDLKSQYTQTEKTPVSRKQISRDVFVPTSSVKFLQVPNSELNTNLSKSDVELSNNNPIISKKKNKYICDMCGKSYASNFTRKRHLSTIHKVKEKIDGNQFNSQSQANVSNVNDSMDTSNTNHKRKSSSMLYDIPVKYLKRDLKRKRTNHVPEDDESTFGKKVKLDRGLKRKLEDVNDIRKKVKFDSWM